MKETSKPSASRRGRALCDEHYPPRLFPLRNTGSSRAPGLTLQLSCVRRDVEGSAVMEIPKEEILAFLQERVGSEQAAQLEQELPDQVDPEQHGNLLSKFGIAPQELISRFSGDIL